MSLRELAESDLAVTLEDDVNGFGWPVTITNPDTSESQTLNGQVHRISQEFDPQVGAWVRTKKLAITIRTSTLTIGEIKQNWKVSTINIDGTSVEGVAKSVLPDQSLGLVTFFVSV